MIYFNKILRRRDSRVTSIRLAVTVCHRRLYRMYCG